jgi:anti-sigma B factor antagonist
VASGYSHPNEFGLDVVFLEDSISVALNGELDLATAPILLEHLADFASQGQINISLDIADVTFIESSVLSVIVMAQKHLRELGGYLVVQQPTDLVLRLFEITGLTPILMEATAGPLGATSEPVGV